ncbi:MAG TPA: response regulator [Candidatus Limnocylindria bacterium]|jgi:CheY-like chemotaxis protein|nr:response regulator [Candidatus Limnocylindria bacterium]
MRLLLVDDNALNLELFQDVLEAAGHQVVVEADSFRGQRRALAERFDLIVLDIQMPGADGYVVCKSLRASGLRGPIIALSSNALPEHIAAGRDAGFDAYLTKPITPAALREAVARLGSPA